MKTNYLQLILLPFLMISGDLFLHAQQSSEQSEKEIIIIERTVDEDGNEISKTITRRNGDELSETEMKELLDNGSLPGAFQSGDSWKNFNWSFGDGLGTDTRPTIGLSLSFEGDKAIVSEVMVGSDAEEEDIRKGDHLLSINRMPISNFEDVKEALDGRAVGEEVDVVIFRDGQEIEKSIELRVNRFGEMGFAFPDDWGANGFFFDFDNQGEFKLLADSLLKQFDFERLMPEIRSWRGSDEDTDKKQEEKGQLGVFIEDSAGGVVITEVIRDSPADKAGLQEGDVIKRLNDEVVTSYRELVMVMDRKVKGDKLVIEIDRGKSIKEIEVELN